ncbi:SRPBCC family protein [Nocardioides sp.]|uniref:SRPBCC family protein n=1 Tax=Nocardioides sp. TaxID=35761 RepID=UPI002ED87924
MRDLVEDLAEVHRAVRREGGDGDEVVRVTMRRTYDTERTDLWSALTDPERIARWFMPITGELRPGGHFQLEGNAGGDILECEPPERLRTTFGGPESIVTVTLTGVGEATELRLDHTVPLAMAQSVAGALFVGPGWDGAFLGLGMHVAGEAIGDPREMALAPEVVPFTRRSIELWTAVVADSGATPEETAAGRHAAVAQFVPQDLDV